MKRPLPTTPGRRLLCALASLVLAVACAGEGGGAGTDAASPGLDALSSEVVDAAIDPDRVAEIRTDGTGDDGPDGSDAAHDLRPLDASPDGTNDLDDTDTGAAVDVAPDGTGDTAPDAGPDIARDVARDTAEDSGGDTGLDPERPYPWLDALEGEALRDALAELCAEGHVPLSYATARAYLFGAAEPGLDVHDDRIEGVYTGVSATADGTTSPDEGCLDPAGAPVADCEMNTEHSWPRGDLRDYLGDGTAAFDDAEADLHHLFPTLATANSLRGSFRFLAVDCAVDPCAWEQGGSARVQAGGDLFYFHVRPETRGDIARAHVYMALRYDMPFDDPLEEQTIRRWNREDPPDEEERRRNEAIAALQGNVNPLVLRPDLVDRLPDLGSGALADACPREGIERWTESAWCVDGCDGRSPLSILYAGQDYQGTGLFLRGVRQSGSHEYVDGASDYSAPRVTIENEVLVWELVTGELELQLSWDQQRSQGRLAGTLSDARFRLLRRLSDEADPETPEDWAPNTLMVPWCLSDFSFDESVR